MDPKVSPSLEPAVKTVKGVLHGLNEIKEKGGTPKSSEITRLQGRLSEVDAQYREGRFEISPGVIPEGQAYLSELLTEARLLAEELLEKAEG